MRPAGKDDAKLSAEYIFRQYGRRDIRIRRCQFLINCLDHQRHHQHDLRFEDAHIADHMHKGIVDA